MENLRSNKNDHKINIDNRRKIDITGVTAVHTFNEDQINLSTIMGNLIIRGKDLKVNKLSVEIGEVSIIGEIAAINYTTKDENKRENFFKKLFK